MNFEQRCTVSTSRERLWQFLMDVPRVGACVPGVASVTPSGDSTYRGIMQVRVGPVSLNLAGQVTVTEMNRDEWRAALHAEATVRRVAGGVNARLTMVLKELDSQQTELCIQAEVRLLGKLGEFGQPLIRRKADATMQEFARNLSQRILQGGEAQKT